MRVDAWNWKFPLPFLRVSFIHRCLTESFYSTKNIKIIWLRLKKCTWSWAECCEFHTIILCICIQIRMRVYWKCHIYIKYKARLYITCYTYLISSFLDQCIFQNAMSARWQTLFSRISCWSINAGPLGIVLCLFKYSLENCWPVKYWIILRCCKCCVAVSFTDYYFLYRWPFLDFCVV